MTTHVLRGRYGNYTVDDAQLDSGGQATVFRVAERLPSGEALLYKRFDKVPSRHNELAEFSHRIDLLVDVGHTVFAKHGLTVGTTPASSFSWPVDAVRNSYSPLGVILPRAPVRFLRSGSSKAHTMEYLYLYRTQPPPAFVRVLVLVRLCRAMEYLTSNDLVHGDIAPRNIMWTADPDPEVFILDTDGIHRSDARYYGHVSTDQWEDPRVELGLIQGHDMRSDWFALALFIYRCLLGTNSRIPAIGRDWPGPKIDPLIPARIGQSLHRVLVGRDREDLRLAPADWTSLLIEAFFGGGRANTTSIAAIDVALARRRRSERRSGVLGPPFNSLAECLRVTGISTP
jgi:hypothetical protein